MVVVKGKAKTRGRGHAGNMQDKGARPRRWPSIGVAFAHPTNKQPNQSTPAAAHVFLFFKTQQRFEPAHVLLLLLIDFFFCVCL
jgi:hypothetical protein